MCLSLVNLLLLASFLLLLRVRLEGLFLCLPCMVVFTVMFPVVIINSYCQSIHVLERGGFFLFLGRDKILDLIGESLVIAVVEYTIPPTQLRGIVSRLLTMDFIFPFHFIFLFLFPFIFLLFSIFRSTWVRGYQSCCHISHRLMAKSQD